MPKIQIASEIGISTRTHREISRGMVKGLLNFWLLYFMMHILLSLHTHRKYLEAMKGKEGTLKIGKNRKLIEYVENSMLNDKNFSMSVALENAKKKI